MKFEDTKLPDTPETRTGFDLAVIETNMVKMSNPHLTDDGLNPASLSLRVRAAQVLLETVPTASPEQLAGATIFLTYAFGQPVLMKRSRGDELPQVAAWSQEWRDVQRGKTPLGMASVELRQIIMAVNVAMLEGYKSNFAKLDAWELSKDLMEKDRMAYDVRDISSPALAAKYKSLRDDLGQLMAPPATPNNGFKPPKP